MGAKAACKTLLKLTPGGQGDVQPWQPSRRRLGKEMGQQGLHMPLPR